MSNVHPLFEAPLALISSHMTRVLAPDGSEQEARLPPEEPKPTTASERVTRLRAEYHSANEEVLRAMRRAEGLWSMLLKAEDEERDERNQH